MSVSEPGSEARELVRQARSARGSMGMALAAPSARLESARDAYLGFRSLVARKQLDETPVARIKDITQGRVRLGLIEGAGYRTVGAVLRAGVGRLSSIRGVGDGSARQAVAAARQLAVALEEETRVRFDPDSRDATQTRLLGELFAYGEAKSLPDLRPLAASIDSLLEEATRGASRFKMFFSGSRKKESARDALASLAALMASPEMTSAADRVSVVLSASIPRSDALWADYTARAVYYNGLLIEVGGLSPDEAASQGFLPTDIARRVHEYPLDLSLVKASLRGYQAFGAKFALAQERAIIGDEMGLGKTVQALAAMSHLYARDQRHLMVVCPASVVVNWTREVTAHTKMQVHRIHGPERAQSFAVWVARGGVGVTTFEGLRSLSFPSGLSLAMLTVDEAHYVKNPGALRTRAVVSWATRTPLVLFLTGTPMENRVSEFRSLVEHLQPSIAATLGTQELGLGAGHRFRRAVAPVYLRRDQEDVLSELPPRIETQEWVELEGEALDAYRSAVRAGNFMAMRRAAFVGPGSAKLKRLEELVSEAASNGRKVVVFSYFLDVVRSVCESLGSRAVGPLTGSVPPTARQGLVDSFTARREPAVLVSQINAGGVGLNIQAASVVILCEPQWTPAIEEQAIARCHRMGQVRPVDVHRLLCENSVDQRMLDILGAKSALFDEYARRSEIKEVSPDAVDVSDLAAAKETASRVEDERRIIEMERKRLRVDS